MQRSKLDELTNRLVSIFKEEVEKGGGRAEVQVTFLYPEINLDQDAPVVQLAVRAAERAGLKPVLTSTGEAVTPVLLTARVFPVLIWGLACARCTPPVNIFSLMIW